MAEEIGILVRSSVEWYGVWSFYGGAGSPRTVFRPAGIVRGDRT